jgi:hypothetical protein
VPGELQHSRSVINESRMIQRHSHSCQPEMTTTRALDQMAESPYGTCRRSAAMIEKPPDGPESSRLFPPAATDQRPVIMRVN